MNLREWMSNDSQVNQFINKEDMANCESMKILGHTWNIKNDSISLKKPNKFPLSNIVSKRDVLKGLSSVFDPLGLFENISMNFQIDFLSMFSKDYSTIDLSPVLQF